MALMGSSSLKSTKNIFKQEETKEKNIRICSTYIFLIILILLGLPIWWNKTTIYRATLPLSKMQEIHVSSYSNKTIGIPLSTEYDLLISFINPDPGPSNSKIMINGEDIEEYLLPFLKEISCIFKFFIKSQWVYILNMEISPTKHIDHYALNQKQLPYIITPLEKKLWSHFSTRPTINLILYFQPCNDRPLYIFDEDNKRVRSNAFLSPAWGGIYIINPDKESCQKGIFEPNLQHIVSTFVAQIQKLFNIDNILDPDKIYELKMRKTFEMIDSTRRTLRSLAELLSEIEKIVISDDIAEKIYVAMESADLAQKLLSTGDVNKSLDLAKTAFEVSEDAFSDPSLVSMIYFPHEDKKAVYLPLCLPIGMAVFSSLPTLFKLMGSKKKTKL